MYMTPQELIEAITSREPVSYDTAASPATMGCIADLIDRISGGMLFCFDMDEFDSSPRLINPAGVHWLKARSYLELAEQELRLSEYHAIKQRKASEGSK